MKRMTNTGMERVLISDMNNCLSEYKSKYIRYTLEGRKEMLRYIDNWVIVRIWSAKGVNDVKYKNADIVRNILTAGEVSHVSIQTKNIYVSLWPERRPTVIESIFHTGTEKHFNTKEEDFTDEGRIADTCIVLHTLDVKEIERIFSSLDNNLYYDLIGSSATNSRGQNCSGLVAQLLSAGIEAAFNELYGKKIISNAQCKLLAGEYHSSFQPIPKDLDEAINFEKKEHEKLFHFKIFKYNENEIYTPNDIAHLATKLKLEEINLFRQKGAQNNEIAALDVIDSKYFLDSEININAINFFFQELGALAKNKKCYVPEISDEFNVRLEEQQSENFSPTREIPIELVQENITSTSNNRNSFFKVESSNNHPNEDINDLEDKVKRLERQNEEQQRELEKLRVQVNENGEGKSKCLIV